jgi:hypothetical protein
MDPPDLELRDPSDIQGDLSGAAPPDSGEEPREDGGGLGWLEEIVARLEEDPDECWPAIEGLSELDEEARVQVIAMLGAYRDRPGVQYLLRLLGSARDSAVREVATGGLPLEPGPSDADGRGCANPVDIVGSLPIPASTALPVLAADGVGRHLMGEPGLPSGRIVRSLVTAVDGDGGGMIMVSTRGGGYLRTAAFRCDVRGGILDVVGEVEKDHSSAGRLIDEWIRQADAAYVLDVPELAVRLLGGSIALCGPYVPPVFQAWLDATIGPGILSAGLPVALPVPDIQIIPDHEMLARADLVLEACPGWLDRSALTYEMAREIALREGYTIPHPIRDSGAYRYLFEHRLIGRLELYARMLLWMGWFWHAAGRAGLARLAFVLAGELSDEQHAVPSHPFTVSLTTRSLRAAQAELSASRRSGSRA